MYIINYIFVYTINYPLVDPICPPTLVIHFIFLLYKHLSFFTHFCSNLCVLQESKHLQSPAHLGHDNLFVVPLTLFFSHF